MRATLILLGAALESEGATPGETGGRCQALPRIAMGVFGFGEPGSSGGLGSGGGRSAGIGVRGSSTGVSPPNGLCARRA